MAIKAINPATGKVIKEYRPAAAAEVKAAVAKAHEAFQSWRERTFAERAEPMHRAAAILSQRKKEFAELFTREMGKPIKQAVAEVEKCAWVCQFYADNAAGMLAREVIPTDGRESYVQFDPLGVILAVMPWNFPFWQVFRFAAPALMAGNVCLLKHASNVPGSALAIEEIFREAGLPRHALQTLLIDAARAGRLVGHPLVRAVTLTGSEPAGRSIAKVAGQNLKKVVLELGGSDPFVVFPDCDLEKTVANAIQSKMFNTGQSCIAAKRFILVGGATEPFTAALAERFRKLRSGDPLDEANDLGPLAREEFVAELERQVQKSVELGARALVGGRRAAGPGFFFAPTILDGVAKGMPAYDEEIFGPVAALIHARDGDEALRIANDSPYGLGASLWTADIEKARRLAAKVESGMVFINGMVKSDPRLPFGGVKCSGYGREMSHYGIKEFVNIKTVWIG